MPAELARPSALFAGPRPRDPMRRGLACSTALHGTILLILVLLGLTDNAATIIPPSALVPIDLVWLSGRTGGPPAPIRAVVPQEQAAEATGSPQAQAVPEAQTPPPPAAPHPAADTASPARPTVPPVTLEATSPLPAPAHRRDAAAAPLRAQPAPADPLSLKLQALARLRQTAPALPPDPRPQAGQGLSNVTASSDSAAARQAGYGIADVIRVQVERRWNLDPALPRGVDWVARIHVELAPDGTVTRAEIVEDPRHRNDRAYLAFALGARNAVLLSSPLSLPPDSYALARDVIVEFSPKEALK